MKHTLSPTHTVNASIISFPLRTSCTQSHTHYGTLWNMHSVLWMGMTLLCFPTLPWQPSSQLSLAALQTHFIWKIPLNRHDLWRRERPLATSFSKHSVGHTSVITKAGRAVANDTESNPCYFSAIRGGVRANSFALWNISHCQREVWPVGDGGTSSVRQWCIMINHPSSSTVLMQHKISHLGTQLCRMFPQTMKVLI